MIEVFYQSPKGASIGRAFQDDTALIAFISKLRKPARIMVNGEHVGRVWKNGDRWEWFYDPSKLHPRPQ